jgi:uncharacterized protein GlcG (DUF336 family)
VTSISLSQAQAIVNGAIEHARSKDAKPLSIVVLDAGAHPVAFAREDGASLYRYDIAVAKAKGAIGMGADSRVLADRAKGNPVFYQSVAAAVGGSIAFSPGGVLIRSNEGDIIGAVGISGDTGECDEACALAGIDAAGLNEGAKA